MEKPSPIRPTDDQARDLARSLLAGARIAALGTIEPETATPMVTRIALALCPQGEPLTLISDLSHHTRALRANPDCSILVGEVTGKGDPLTHPRLTLQCRAEVLPRNDPAHPSLRAHYLARHPKSKLYIDFADFSFVRLTPARAYLNGGFGRAFVLTPHDLRA